MDMVAEYAARYGTPRADMTWHEMLALVKRTGRFEMRERLIQAEAEALGRSPNDGTQMLMRAKLERLAWPGAD